MRAIGLVCALCSAGAAFAAPAVRNLDRLPLPFEPNRGQAGAGISFLARTRGMDLLLTGDGAVLQFEKRRVRMRVEGANPLARVSGEEALGGHSNYLIGRDARAWKTDVPHYGKVRYRDIYPGIDLVYYSNQGKFEYDFVVAPGADPSRLAVRFEGVRTRLGPNGDVRLEADGREIYQRRPVAYQVIGGERRQVEASYVLAKGAVRMQVGEYDRSRPLVVDPVLTYSTFLGGSAGDRGGGIAVDGAGNVYVTGATASGNFPKLNWYQDALKGGNDVFVTKINAAGSAILYSTFIGGTQTISGFGFEYGTDIAVDPAGAAYVTGVTNSSNFPITSGSFQTVKGGTFDDAFVLKLNAVGNGLVYSTFLGGISSDKAFGIAIDSAGSAYVAGYTESNNFPISNAFQAIFKGGGADGFVARLNAAGTQLLFSSYYGGTGEDHAFDVALDPQGNAYITGETQSNDLTVVGAYQNSRVAAKDAFVAKVGPGGTLMYSTYLGGGAADQGFAIAADATGAAFVAGETASTNFPAVGAYQATMGGFSDAFVTKVAPTGASLLYSTYVGGNLTDGAFALAIDGQGQAHITGRTWSSNFPRVDAFQTTYGGDFTDGFVAKLAASGGSLIYSSFLGGSKQDNADNSAGFLGVGGVAIDGSGNAYYTGRTDSENFPTTAGSLQTVFGGRSFAVGDDNAYDAFVVKIGTAPIGGGGGTQTGLRFQPVTPCRVADTRNADGAFGGPAIPGGQFRTFTVPASACGIPASAKAYSLNVTAVPRGSLAYLTIWPAGQSQPVVSTLNSFAGDIVANAAVVPAGTNGAISVFVTNTADVVLDINGYFDTASANNYSFYTAVPCRVADTRNANGTFGGPILAGGASRSFPIPASGCGIPQTAAAYSLNVTVVPSTVLAYLTIWPTGVAQPFVSTLNSFLGKVVANAALVPAGTDGAASVYVTNPTHGILDINGYFAAPGANGLVFEAVTPCRVADTRNAAGPLGGPVMQGGETRAFPVPQACGIPAGAKAYSLNVTVVPEGPLAYLSIWPTGVAQPLVSTLNSFDGSVVANAAMVPAGGDGGINVFVTNRTHVILDINGYFRQ